jgi:two-component system, NarL family, sensor histidine kinase DegS
MFDNNKNNERVNLDLLENSMSSCNFLKDFTIELEDQENELDILQKQYMEQLIQKQAELKEKERNKIQNMDLFSPIYNINYNTTDIISEIDHLQQQLNEIKISKEMIRNKINQLVKASNNINKLIVISNNSANENEIFDQRKFNEKGLSILEAQEIERQRIARDLHDSTVQNLTSLVHKTELCNKLIDIDSIRAKLELTTMSHTIKTVINDMRGVIYNLKPMSIEDLGLTVTVERYAKQLMSTNNITVFVHANDETKDILPVINLTLFRIIQEACVNVLKHAKATMISIDICYKEQGVIVIVKDNGVGFDKSEYNGSLEHSSSFGLSIMKERISLLSGNLDVQSEKGKGTIITVSAPLTIYEGDKNE